MADEPRNADPRAPPVSPPADDARQRRGYKPSEPPARGIRDGVKPGTGTFALDDPPPGRMS